QVGRVRLLRVPVGHARPPPPRPREPSPARSADPVAWAARALEPPRRRRGGGGPVSARDELDRWQALADGATEGLPPVSEGRAARAVDAVVLVAFPAAVKALRDVLDELDEWERAG